MEAYLDGDQQAFRSLFRLLAPRVHGFFVRRFGDAQVADDLLQVTFMKLHRARQGYRIGSPVRPWLFTIAARVGLDEARRQGRRRERADSEIVEQKERRQVLHGQDEPALDPIDRRRIAVRVREAIGRLPESQRVVLHLHRYEGLTFGEIADVIGSTEGAVKLRAFRAYQQLRKRLAPLASAHRSDHEAGDAKA